MSMKKIILCTLSFVLIGSTAQAFTVNVDSLLKSAAKGYKEGVEASRKRYEKSNSTYQQVKPAENYTTNTPTQVPTSNYAASTTTQQQNNSNTYGSSVTSQVFVDSQSYDSLANGGAAASYGTMSFGQ